MQSNQNLGQSWFSNFNNSNIKRATFKKGKCKLLVCFSISRMSELIEKETEEYRKRDPDPFDDRHPGKLRRKHLSMLNLKPYFFEPIRILRRSKLSQSLFSTSLLSLSELTRGLVEGFFLFCLFCFKNGLSKKTINKPEAHFTPSQPQLQIVRQKKYVKLWLTAFKQSM